MLHLWRCSLISLLIVSLALLTSCTDDEDYSDNGSAVKDNEDNTLSDDEDFSGKVPVTLFATTTLSCSEWKEEDRVSGSQTIINKMIVYIAGVCGCGFDNDYISPFRTDCDPHAGTLLVSTNVSLPFNHQKSQVVAYLENWIRTEPSFTKTLNKGGRATVSVVDLETHSLSSPPLPDDDDDGSGDDETPTSGTETPSTGTEDNGNTESTPGEEGSGSGDDNVLDSSSRHSTAALEIGTILTSCVTALVFSLHQS